MLRISQYMRAAFAPETKPQRVSPAARADGPVVIWNLLRRCNLKCRHCYAFAADFDFPGELSTPEIMDVMDDLKSYGVPVLILSGGEPMMHPDILPILSRAKSMGFYVTLSTNGTTLTPEDVEVLAEQKVDYIGISLDGLKERHDYVRREEGSFDKALRGIRLCRDAGLPVGARFTLTKDNAEDLPGLLDLVKEENIDKFYLSHLNYAGRGIGNRRDDVMLETTRKAVELVFESCAEDIRNGIKRDYVSGNNDADGVFLKMWLEKHHLADIGQERMDKVIAMLERWGGNSTGVKVANIDNMGDVHPDSMWWGHTIGSVKKRPFSEIWNDPQDPVMDGLRQKPRPVTGRCGECKFIAICGGNTRTRALQACDDPWASDPGCYLSDAEIGIFKSDSPDSSDAKVEAAQ
ncbi:heme d1 biosynthesis radical SAM protein NirJ [Kiloniella laminariae]|uniref:Heme d1 biosynthesis radical SAM protein NirJ n=1 Tax=Kiloniella laminariae TaxID=454162 RepID=A0ABT4LGT2_9PROT|nr:heme d1 biosynthesis radical SAM protein NirJ [Kiloniella laminariae]MCZ4280309.1 heme d1 biosynthesis radical SAM protein NirJ [Kiloniella laminariae]